MSRIHEALKKAEQEKASQQSQAPGPVSAPRYREGSSIPPFTTNAVVEPPVGKIRANNVLGGIRFEELVARCTHPEWKATSELLVPLTGESQRAFGERFRTLRSRLYQVAGTRTLRRVLVTSSVQGEGKTFVATNLVRSIIRQADRRVLLIDADLRAPRLHTSLGAPSGPGLSDFLRGEADEYQIIQNSSMAPNLCFIPCGSRVSNPSELLLSDRMKALLDTIAPAFDWVILDTPPSLPVHDANSLADICDGVLFVVKAGETAFESAKKAASGFREKNLLGVVLNQVEDSGEDGAQYYGSHDHK